MTAASLGAKRAHRIRRPLGSLPRQRAATKPLSPVRRSCAENPVWTAVPPLARGAESGGGSDGDWERPEKGPRLAGRGALISGAGRAAGLRGVSVDAGALDHAGGQAGADDGRL